MDYSRELDSEKIESILGRIEEASPESPINMYYNDEGVFSVMFGRTVVAEKFGKAFGITDLGSFYTKSFSGANDSIVVKIYRNGQMISRGKLLNVFDDVNAMLALESATIN
jgi:hypothetical protein